MASFVTHLHHELEVATIGCVCVDIAYGGMFYVVADANRLGLELNESNAAHIARIGRMICEAAAQQIDVRHPLNHNIRGVTIALITKPPVPT